MTFYRNLILIIFLSYSICEKEFVNIQEPQYDDIKQIDEQIKNTKDPEFRKALEKLREEYILKRKNIRNDYKSKIEPIKKQRDVDIQTIRKEFQSKKDALMKEYGIKPKNINKNKKNKPYNKPKKPPIYKTNKDKPPIKKKNKDSDLDKK